MIKISVANLEAVRSTRPVGYYEDVISAGRVENGILSLEDSVYHELRKKYTPEATTSQKITNITGAAGRVVSSILGGRGVTVSEVEKARRMAICATCEFFTGTTCKKCGCHIRFKAKLTTEHCPINKW